MRSHAARRSFFIQKGVLRGRLLGCIFALSFQKQIFRTQFGLDAVAPGAGAFGFVAPHVPRPFHFVKNIYSASWNTHTPDVSLHLWEWHVFM